MSADRSGTLEDSPPPNWQLVIEGLWQGWKCDHPRVDVVFIHGLGAHWERTWRGENAAESWMRWLGRDVGHANVFALDYEVAKTRWGGHAMPLSRRAKKMLATLEMELTSDRPLVLIGHSMGGLHIKQLIVAAAMPDAKESWAQLARRVRGIVFFATPHKGSKLATLATWLPKWLFRPTVAISELVSGAPPLNMLQGHFRDCIANRGIKICAYAEDRKTSRLGGTFGAKVVDEESANVEIGGVPLEFLEGDHSSICRFENDKALAYKQTLKLVLDVAGGMPTAAARQSPPPTPTNLPDQDQRFTARNKAMRELHELIQTSGQAGLGQAAAVWADGGVGKTMLAEQYGWDHMRDYPGGVFRVDADAISLIPALASLAAPLGISKVYESNPTIQRSEMDIAADVKARLESTDSLLILDNVPGAARWVDSAYRDTIPKGRCRRLVTTREEYLDGLRMQHLDVFTPEEGVEVLARHRDDAAAPANAQYAREISAWFDGLGAGLLVAGVYMAVNKEISWKAYATSLGAGGLAMARETHAQVVDKITYKRRFDSAFDQALRSLSEHEQRALEYAALLPEDMVPVRWIETLMESDTSLKEAASPPGYSSVAEAAVNRLRSLGLLRNTQTRGHVVALHRVLRETTRDGLAAQPNTMTSLIAQIAKACRKPCNQALKPAVEKCSAWELAAAHRLKVVISAPEFGEVRALIDVVLAFHYDAAIFAGSPYQNDGQAIAESIGNAQRVAEGRRG